MGGAGFPPCCVSLWLLLCPWTWGILLGKVQGLPVNDCPAASCDSGALARGSESTSFYSAILVNLTLYILASRTEIFGGDRTEIFQCTQKQEMAHDF